MNFSEDHFIPSSTAFSFASSALFVVVVFAASASAAFVAFAATAVAAAVYLPEVVAYSVAVFGLAPPANASGEVAATVASTAAFVVVAAEFVVVAAVDVVVVAVVVVAAAVEVAAAGVVAVVAVVEAGFAVVAVGDTEPSESAAIQWRSVPVISALQDFLASFVFALIAFASSAFASSVPFAFAIAFQLAFAL